MIVEIICRIVASYDNNFRILEKRQAEMTARLESLENRFLAIAKLDGKQFRELYEQISVLNRRISAPQPKATSKKSLQVAKAKGRGRGKK